MALKLHPSYVTDIQSMGLDGESLSDLWIKSDVPMYSDSDCLLVVDNPCSMEVINIADIRFKDRPTITIMDKDGNELYVDQAMAIDETFGVSTQTNDDRYLLKTGGEINGGVSMLKSPVGFTFPNGQWNNIGDDTRFGDINVANTFGVQSTSNNAVGYIRFGNTTSGTTIGTDGTKFTISTPTSAQAISSTVITEGGTLLTNKYVNQAVQYTNPSWLAGIDATTIKTGTIDLARLPALPSSNTIVCTTIPAMTSADQLLVAKGTVVIESSTGNTYRYSGSGSVVLNASYIQQSDLTPDWAVITNKPTNVSTWTNDAGYLTAASSLAWAKLTGVPSTFAPSAHTHTQAEITGLETRLAGIDGNWVNYATTTALTNGLATKSDTSHIHTFASLTSKPTTLSGYGITDAATSGHNHDSTYLKRAAGSVHAAGTFLATYPTLAVGDGQYGMSSLGGTLNLYSATGTVSIRSRSGSADAVYKGDIWHSGNFNPATKSDSGHTHAWISGLTGVPSHVGALANATTHGNLKLGATAAGSWHAIEGSDANLTRVMFNDNIGNNIMGFYGLNAAKSSSLWYVSWDRSGNMVDGWVPWARLQNVPSTFTPSAHNQAWSTITGTPTTLAGYGITDAASSTHSHNTTYQPLENQRLSIASNVRFGSVTTTAAVNVEGQLGVTGLSSFSSNVTVTGYVSATKFVTNGGNNTSVVLGDGTLKALSDFASSSSLGSYALSSHTHTQIEVSNTNEIVLGNGFNDVAGKLYVNWRGAGTNRISDYMLCDGKGAGIFSYITAAGFKLNGGAGNNLLSDNGSAVAISSFALAGHNHNSTYAPLVHNHDSAYFKLNPASTQTVTGASTIFISPIEARGASLFVADVALDNGSYSNAALEVSRSTNNNTYHAGIGFHNAGNNAAYLYYSNSTGKFRFRRNSPDDLGLWDSSDFSSANIGNWNTAWTRVAGGRLCEDTYTGEDTLSWISRMGRGNHWGRIHGVHGAPSYYNYMLMRETTGTVYGAIGYAADGKWYVGKSDSNTNIGTYHRIWTTAEFSDTAVARINNSDSTHGFSRLYRSDNQSKYYLRHGWTTGQWYGSSWRMTCANDHADSQSGIFTVAINYADLSLKAYSLTDAGKYQSNLDTGFKDDYYGLWAGSIDAPTGTTPFGNSWTWLQEWGHSNSGWRAQMGIHYFSDGLAYRRKANGTWQPWKYVVTTDSVGTISNKIESPRITSQRSLITVAGTYQVDTLNDTIVVTSAGVTLRGFVMDGVVTIYNAQDTGVIYDNNGSLYYQQGVQRTATITIPARRCLIIRGGVRNYPHVSLD